MTNATSSTPSGQPLGISHKPSPTETMFDEFKAADKRHSSDICHTDSLIRIIRSKLSAPWSNTA